MHEDERKRELAQATGQFLSAFGKEVRPLILQHCELIRTCRERLLGPQDNPYALDGIEYAMQKSEAELVRVGLDWDDIDKIYDIA